VKNGVVVTGPSSASASPLPSPKNEPLLMLLEELSRVKPAAGIGMLADPAPEPDEIRVNAGLGGGPAERAPPAGMGGGGLLDRPIGELMLLLILLAKALPSMLACAALSPLPPPDPLAVIPRIAAPALALQLLALLPLLAPSPWNDRAGSEGCTVSQRE